MVHIKKILKKKRMQGDHYKMKSESQLPGVFYSPCSSADSSVGLSFPTPHPGRAAGCRAEVSEILLPEARYRYPCPLGGATAGWPSPQSPWGQAAAWWTQEGCVLLPPSPVPPIQAPFCHRFSMTWCLLLLLLLSHFSCVWLCVIP